MPISLCPEITRTENNHVFKVHWLYLGVVLFYLQVPQPVLVKLCNWDHQLTSWVKRLDLPDMLYNYQFRMTNEPMVHVFELRKTQIKSSGPQGEHLNAERTQLSSNFKHTPSSVWARRALVQGAGKVPEDFFMLQVKKTTWPGSSFCQSTALKDLLITSI